MLSGVWCHRPVGGFIRHEATLKCRDARSSTETSFTATAYFADASSGWGTEGSSTIGGNFDFPAKRCCTRSR